VAAVVSAPDRATTRSESRITDESSRPRVLILSENAPVPADVRVWNEARTLTEAGYEVVIVCAALGKGDDVSTEPFEILEGIEIHRYPLKPAESGAVGYLREYSQALLRARRVILDLASERHFDVVHACNPPDLMLLAARPLRRRGTRFIFDHHDLVPELYRTRFGERQRFMHKMTLRAERLAFSLADVVICPNQSYREIALTRGGCHADDVFVVRNGPNLERLRLIEPDPSLKRGRPHLISYVGAMAPQDGLDHAIKALASVRERREDWHAIFMGDGESLKEMRELARTLGVDEMIHFAGWSGDDYIRRVLSTSDVCLAPEPPNPLNELSTMIKITEYMAMSRPVVSYDLRESRLSAGDAALYARADEPESFADCIDQLLTDRALRTRMGEAGRYRVETELSWDYSARELRAAYARALSLDRRSVLAPAGYPAGSGTRLATNWSVPGFEET
jgi:glycosyltransferase involved in cell wall biosynthesis